MYSFDNKYIVGGLALIISLLITSCVEDISSYSNKQMNLQFEPKVGGWNADSIITRSANNDTLSIKKIPMYADDGEEFVLTMTTTRDTTWKPLNENQTVQTRTASITSLTNQSFQAYAYINGDGVADQQIFETSTGANNGITLKVASNGTWMPTTGTTYDWPSPTQVITIFGIIPASTPYSVNDKTLTFTQNLTASSQTDLLVGATEPLNQAKDANTTNAQGQIVPKPIPIYFRHALTAINIVINNLPTLTLNNIQLQGFSYKGVYTLPTGNRDGSWAPGATGTFTTGSVKASVTSGSYTINGSNTFLMIPQSLSASKKIILNVTSGGKARTITGNFSGQTAWKPGQLVTYTLNKKTDAEYHLYTNGYQGDGQHRWNEGWNSTSFTVKVTSYKVTPSSSATTGSSTPTAVPWRAYWSTDNATWNQTNPVTFSYGGTTFTMTADTWEGTGLGTINSSNIVDSQSMKFTGKTPAPVTYSGVRINNANAMTSHTGTQDLSTYDVFTKQSISRTTANCYIINGTGTFRIPCYYGNSVKNGSVNSGAMRGLDYNGTAISTSNYYVKSGVASDAVVLWRDSELSNVISNISYTQGNPGYIQFTVNKVSDGQAYDNGRLPPGNVVIGLVNSSKQVIWQWHLFINSADQLDLDLGYTNWGYYASRPGGGFYIKFEQYSGSTVYNTTTLYKHWWGEDTNLNGRKRSPRYVWGYPRPRPAANQTVADNNTGTYTYPVETKNTTSHMNRWGGNGDTKTVFDPSPRGYRLPTYAELSALSIPDGSAFILGWVCKNASGADDSKQSMTLSVEGNGFGSAASAASQTLSGTYLSSGYSGTTVGRIVINNTKSITKGYAVHGTEGMVHPVKE